MAIPGFFKRWIARKVKALHSVIQNLNVSTLSLDLNNILHMIAAYVWCYGDFKDRLQGKPYATKERTLEKDGDLVTEFLNLLGNFMLNLVIQLKPQHYLIIGEDGVVPLGKIQGQRIRRYESVYESSTKKWFDSNRITPGTPFMDDIRDFINKWVKTNQDILPHVIYSSDLTPGEGEHKIMDLLKNKIVHKPNEYHYIFGADADLILLSGLREHNIFLFRPQYSINDMKAISLLSNADKRNDRSIEPSILDIVDIPKVRDYLSKNGLTMKEFVFIMNFVGNDFVPRQFSFQVSETDIDYLINVHKQVGIKSINENNFNMYISKFTSLLKSEEQKTFPEGVKDMVKFFNEPELQSVSFNQIWYGREWNTCTLEIKHWQDKLELMLYYYMHTLWWVYKYYDRQLINEWWYYPYSRAPLITDIAQYSSQLDFKPEILGHQEKFPQITIPMQLLAVIPLESMVWMPDFMKELTKHKYFTYIRPLFPSSMIRDFHGQKSVMDQINTYWLPKVDMEKINIFTMLAKWKDKIKNGKIMYMYHNQRSTEIAKWTSEIAENIATKDLDVNE